MSLFALSAITAAIRKVNQSAEGDPYWDKVVSLLHFDGQDGSTDIQDVRDNTWSAVGATLDTSRKQFGSSSCHLETTTSYVEASSNNFAFGTGDFTIEGMHHADGQTRTEGTLLDNRFGSYGGACVLYRSYASDRLYFYTNGGNRFYEIMPRTEWFHWALVRKNGVIRLYINGVSNNSYTYTGAYDQNTWRLGNNLTGNDGCMGYLDEVRITKGVARYTGTFTPPTKAFPNQITVDPLFDNVTSLLHFDGNLSDEKGLSWTAVGSTSLTASQTKFGPGALRVVNGRLEVGATDAFNFGTDDFTLEFFVYTLSFPSSTPALVATGGSTWNAGEAILRIENGNQLSLYNYLVPGATLLDPNPLPLSQWVHVALTRENGVFRLFKNGVLAVENSGFPTLSVNFNSSGKTIIGNSLFDGKDYNGYIDAFRVTKGVTRYTEDFTPPNEPFPDQGPAVFARHWRIYITANKDTDTSYAAMLAELEFWVDAEQKIDTSTATAIASEEYGNPYTKEKAFDADDSTAWLTKSNSDFPQWIGCEFIEAVAVTQVAITSADTDARAKRTPTSFDLEYSEDGITWQKLGSVIDAAPWVATERRQFVMQN